MHTGSSIAGTDVRVDSLRTGETLLEARRLADEALVVWGTVRRDRYDIRMRDRDSTRRRTTTQAATS